MKKLILSILILSLAGCVTPQGVLFVQTNQAVSVTHGTIGTKTGEACSHGFFGLVTISDGGIREAMQTEQIKTIRHVEQTGMSVLSFLYVQSCIVVHGD